MTLYAELEDGHPTVPVGGVVAEFGMVTDQSACTSGSISSPNTAARMRYTLLSPGSRHINPSDKNH